MRHTAEMLAEHCRELEFQVFENGTLVFDGLAADSLPSNETAVYEDGEMFLFETKSQRVYPLPKRMICIDIFLSSFFTTDYLRETTCFHVLVKCSTK